MIPIPTEKPVNILLVRNLGSVSRQALWSREPVHLTMTNKCTFKNPELLCDDQMPFYVVDPTFI